ncbi:MAG: DUF5615 family PIN-like protein [Anaerolineales bacterium]
MAYRVKVDEDLPAAITQMLNDAGYEAAGVYDQGMGGWKDAPLWEIIQAESRFLITADKGFGDIRFYPPGTHTGVLILRPDQDGIRPAVDLIRQVLAHYRLDDLGGTVTVATPRGIRIRRAPARTDDSEDQE